MFNERVSCLVDSGRRYEEVLIVHPSINSCVCCLRTAMHVVV